MNKKHKQPVSIPPRVTPDPNTGLSQEEARLRVEANLVNEEPPRITRTVIQILRENICTFFNLINVLIFLTLLMVDSYNNLFFMGVVVSNLFIGIIQELRSKRTLDRLTLLNAPFANVVRESVTQKVKGEQIVLDDVLCLSLGQQVPTDCLILTGIIEADESHITGESAPRLKKEGDMLLSGSVVVSGECRVKVERIGKDCYANALSAEAKKYKKHKSELMHSLQLIIRFTAGFVVPLGLLMFFRSYFPHLVLKTAVEQAAASMLGMIPSGLMLLTSISLSIGVITLSRRKTMVQHPYSIETLSRVDMLCLDKTGTLTSGNLTVENAEYADPARAQEIEKMLGEFTAAMPALNPTSRALHAYAQKPIAPPTPLGITAFSSARRYSAASFKDYTLYLGAPESVCPLTPALDLQAQKALKEGNRLLLFAKAARSETPPLPNEVTLEPLCLLMLRDEIRKEAKDTLRFFLKENVAIKLISGDNPKTVSHIARQLDLPGADKYIDVSTLSEQDIMVCAAQYTVFGRVGPEQKRTLINALKKMGHTVAMTGDGVNDLLALRDADCSIALYNGSDAARQISQLVLLTNDFSALPAAVMEGRRVINNISRTASLFLVKTIYSFLLTAGSIILGLSYPFMPVQLTIISMATVGIPSFFLSMEPNRTRIKTGFLKNILSQAIPGGFAIFLYALLSGLLGPLFGLDYGSINTLCVYLTGTAGLLVLLRICLPLQNYRGLLFFSCTIYFFCSTFLLRGLLRLTLPPDWLMLLMYFIMAGACYPLLSLFTRLGRRILKMDR